MLASRINRAFVRLSRPKINQHQDVFHMMRDRQSEVQIIRQINTTRFAVNNMEAELKQQLGLTQEACREASQQTLYATAFSPSLRPFQLKQKLGHQLEVDEVFGENLEGKYQPGGANLKYHYSINQDLPAIPEYQATSTRAYIFKIPEGITEKEIMMELGYRFVKSVTIKYSLLGVPAYAVVDFNSENYLTDRVMRQEMQISLNDQPYPIVTEVDANKLLLSRRQLVLYKISQAETPSSMLRFLSTFGHVMHCDLPMEIYTEQSVDDIKKLYANETEPVRINLHKLDGTIQSEYYPAFSAPQDMEFYEKKNKEYERRLRYCENIDIFEGKAGKVTMKPRGFCVVTFSCQEEAQNCYFHLRNVMKVDLKNGREDFQFDRLHKQALLRHIDNQYIEECKRKNPESQHQDFSKKLSQLTYQSFYLNLIHEKNKNMFYTNGPEILETMGDDVEAFRLHHEYKTSIQRLANSVGKDSFQSQSVENDFGKSFDELAEQELYGARLNKNKTERYEVNIDDYLRPAPEKILDSRTIRMLSKGLKSSEQFVQAIHEKNITYDFDETVEEFTYVDDEEAEVEENEEAVPIQDDDYKGERNFSTFRQASKTIPKTMQQKVRSHMKYNQFVRNTLNEYMGVFSAQKLEKEFGRKKPTFSNPQNLSFLDGSDFLPESQVKKVLEFSAVPSQLLYDSFVKANETVKSLNIDIQEVILKNLEVNDAHILQKFTDMGQIVEQFDFEGENIEDVVRQLNLLQAEIGEKYRAVVNKETGKNKIIKLAILQNIVPLEALEQAEKHLSTVDQQKIQDFPQQNAYFEHIMAGKPLTPEMAKHFNMEAGQIIDLESTMHELSTEVGISIKDFQKMMNLSNYTPQQLSNDIHSQIQMSKVRKQKSAKKATDYSRDPADIKVRGEDGNFVPSKFRQM